MILKDLIERLEQEPYENTIRNGFGHSMSYRGDYSQLAFAPAQYVTVGSMLEEAKRAVGKTYHGYKGGEYTFNKDQDLYVDNYGVFSETMITDVIDKGWCVILCTQRIDY